MGGGGSLVGRQEQESATVCGGLTTPLEIRPQETGDGQLETSKETGKGGGERMSKRSQWRGNLKTQDLKDKKKGHRKLVEAERTKLGRFSCREGASSEFI